MQRFHLVDGGKDNYWLEVAAIVRNSFSLFLQKVVLGERPSFVVGNDCYVARYSVAKLRVFTWFEGPAQGFWLVQHHKNLAVYFPSDKVYVSFYAHENELHGSVLDELDELLCSTENLRQIFDFDYEALLYASYSRPYHYFYDLLPPLLKILKEGERSFDINVVTHESGAFYPLGALPNINEVFFSSFGEMNGWLKSNEVVALKATRDGLFQGDISKYDDFLIGQSSRVSEEDSLEIEIDQFDFVFWFGACAEKRSWVEWEESLLASVDYILERITNRRLVVLIDGMTSPAYSDRKLYLESLRSQAVFDFDALSERLRGKNVLLYSLAGMKAHQKIFISQRVDFFVSGFLTDSIYVSRFGRVEGVGHGATVASPAQHLNPHCYFIPAKFVRDVQSDGNWAKISYSIAKSDFINFFAAIFLSSGQALSISSNEKVRVLSRFSSARTVVLDSYSDSIEYVVVRSASCRGEGYRFDKRDSLLNFRPEGKSLKGSKCFVVGYDKSGEKCFAKGIGFGVTSSVKLSADVKSFEVHLRVVGGDRVWLHDVHWSGFNSVGSVCLGETK